MLVDTDVLIWHLRGYAQVMRRLDPVASIRARHLSGPGRMSAKSARPLPMSREVLAAVVAGRKDREPTVAVLQQGRQGTAKKQVR